MRATLSAVVPRNARWRRICIAFGKSRWGTESLHACPRRAGGVGLICPSRCRVRPAGKRHEIFETVCSHAAGTDDTAGKFGARARRRTLRQFAAEALVREP